MIGRKVQKDRLHGVFARKEAIGLNAILLVNTNSEDPNFVYMTDFTSGIFESSMLLLERRNGTVTLFTSPLEYGTAMAQKPKGMTVVNVDSKTKLDLLKRKISGKAIGINADFLPYGYYLRIKKRYAPKKLTSVSDAFTAVRLVKSDAEIARIRKGSTITKKAIEIARKSLREGMTEKELAAIFENAIRTLGADGTAFSTIVCFGKNAALPHHMPDNTKLKYGDFVLMDVGAKVDNYCSDVTRTFLFGSDRKTIPDYDKKMAVISTVKEAQSLAIKSIKEGVLANKPHMVAQEHIERANGGIYKGKFTHALGHSVGIEVHDGPGLWPGAKFRLKAGTVTSVEPGIYIEGFGGARIEDDVVVTKNGAAIL
jgi:Xaa-Pro aminopeptidase